MSMTDESVLAFEKDLDDIMEYASTMGSLLDLDVTAEDVKADNPLAGILIGTYTTAKDIQERFKTYL